MLARIVALTAALCVTSLPAQPKAVGPLKPAVVFGESKFRAPAAVTSGAISPDGETLLGATANGRLVACDLKSGVVKDLAPIGRLESPLTATRDGKRLVGLADRDVVFWDVTGKEVSRSKPMVSGFRFQVSPKPDGKGVVIVDLEGTIHDRPDAKSATAAVKFSRVVPPMFSPDGKLLALGKDGVTDEAEILDAQTLKKVGSFKIEIDKQDNRAVRVGFAPNNKTFAATAKAGQGLQIRDTATGEVVKKLPSKSVPGDSDANSLGTPVFSPDGATVFAPSGRMIRRWDVAKGEELDPIKVGGTDTPTVLLARGGKALVTFDPQAGIHVWDVATGKETSASDGYSGRMTARGSPDGLTVLVADSAGKIDLWDATTGKKKSAIQSGPPATPKVPNAIGATYPLAGWAAAGKLVTWADPLTGSLMTWDAATGKANSSASGVKFSGAVASPDGKTFAIRQYGAPPSLVDAAGKAVWSAAKVPSGTSASSENAFSPDGKFLVWGTSKRGDKGASMIDLIRLDAATGKEVDRFTFSSDRAGGAPGNIRYSADAKRITFGEGFNQTVVVDAATMKLLMRQNDGFSHVTPDGRTGMSFHNGDLRLTDLDGGKTSEAVPLGIAGQPSFDVMPGGRLLVGGVGGRAVIFKVPGLGGKK